MSYHVDIETSESTDGLPAAHLSIGTGGELGPMIQITLNGEYAQLTRDQHHELARVLFHASEGSLESLQALSDEGARAAQLRDDLRSIAATRPPRTLCTYVRRLLRVAPRATQRSQ